MASVPVDPDGAALQALRAVGLRGTTPRRAVVAWLAEHPHSTADVVAARRCLEPVDDHGFALDEAEVVLRGLCPACIAEDRPADDAHEYKETAQ